jgi:large subunit ribosomal protein L10
VAKTKAQKADEIKRLELIADKKSVIFLKFNGLPVSETSQMRGVLRGSEIGYTVSKKTLIKKVFGQKRSEQKISGEMPSLDGEVSLAYGDDDIAPARETFAFQKKFDGKISLLGGIFQGAFVSKQEIEKIAVIPSMDVLRGMLVNIMNSPIQRFAIGLGALASKKSASN